MGLGLLVCGHKSLIVYVPRKSTLEKYMQHECYEKKCAVICLDNLMHTNRITFQIPQFNLYGDHTHDLYCSKHLRDQKLA